MEVDNSLVVILGFSPFSDSENSMCVIVIAALGILNAKLIIKPTQKRLLIFVNLCKNQWFKINGSNLHVNTAISTKQVFFGLSLVALCSSFECCGKVFKCCLISFRDPYMYRCIIFPDVSCLQNMISTVFLRVNI